MTKLSELLTDETKWCKDAEAKNKRGFKTYPSSRVACQWCLSGAARKVSKTKNEVNSLMKRLETAINKKFPNKFMIGFDYMDMISDFNDHPKTTFAMVQDVIKAAERNWK